MRGCWSVLWWVMAATASVGPRTPLRLVLLHTNDMHARLEPITSTGGVCSSQPCYGGLARVKAYVDQVKASEPNVLFLNAGDNYQGTPYYSLFKWKVMVDVINTLRIDVMSLGNHEFDDGVSGLAPYLKDVKTPSVCANIDVDNEPSFVDANLHPWEILRVGNTLVAVIGYLTPDTKNIAKTGKVVIKDEVTELKLAAEEVRKEGANIVIALGHSGWDVDQKIALEVPGVDVVIGGHTNTFLYTGTPPDREVPVSDYPKMVTQPSGKRVPVVQAFAYTKYVGHLVLNFDTDYKLINATGNPVLLDQAKPQDSEMNTVINTWKEKLQNVTSVKIADSQVDLIGECSAKECNMANLLADAFVDFGVRQAKKDGFSGGWTDAPVALVNGGNFRNSIFLNETGGTMTVGDSLTAMPFSNKIMKITVNGTLFKGLLEHSVRNYDITGVILKGSFLQFSGVQVVYDMGAKPGNRVKEAYVRCGYCPVPNYQPLTPYSNVTFMVSSYIGQGGDGYHMLNQPDVRKVTYAETDSMVLEEYVRRLSPLYIGHEGRIAILNSQQPRSGASTHHSLGLSLLLLSFLLILAS